MKKNNSPEVLEQGDKRKLRGGYYTPPEIAEFICRWAIMTQTQRVLEPSCGDGNFIEAAIKRFIELGVKQKDLFGLVKGIELIAEEALKSKQRAEVFGLNSTTIIHSDFFSFISTIADDEQFDVVIGNPPFIRYQNFPEEHRNKAFEMMAQMGLNPSKLTNIWVPFLVIAANALTRNGKLGMVIPAELFQVKYAAETRVFLSNYFARITIVSFKKLVFNDIQQEVVLLLCEKDARINKGIRVVELDSLEDLPSLNIREIQNLPVKVLEHDTEKWTKYFLDDHEISLLRKLRQDTRIKLAGETMDVDVGLVTGRNEFFMLNEEQVKKWKLQKYVKKVVSRSNHFKGIKFDEQDFEHNAATDLHGYLFLPPNKDFNDLPKACQAYIRYGEANDFHTGYKTRIPKRWYMTPSLWNPDAFVLRQVSDYPKVIINRTDTSSTDTIHRVKLKMDIRPETVAISFLNSLSFAFSEVTGRSYGGGVLTFEPTEIEEIPLPLLKDKHTIDFNHIDTLIRGKDIEAILDIVDEELLIKQLKFSKRDVSILRGIWIKLSGRRSGRKR